MTASSEPPFGIVRVAPFAGLVHRFDDLIGSATTMALYFIHSRRWRENHDAAIKAFVGRAGTTLEVFLPDLEDHELMFSFDKFDDRAVIALYSNSSAKKELPAFEITTDCFLGEFLAADTEDLKKECRKRAPQNLEAVIGNATPT